MYGQVFDLHAQLLKALANPRRLEIIHLLRDQELSVSDIHNMLDLPQANISQHLTILRESQVVTAVRKGKEVYYSLSDVRFCEASDSIRAILIEKIHDSELQKLAALNMTQLTPLVHDPVCKMRLSPKTAGFTHLYNNKNYYFCASGCLRTFKEQPEKYANS